MSLAQEQPRLAPVQPWGCPALRPSPEKTTCSFPYQFSGKSRNPGLVPGNRDPNPEFDTVLVLEVCKISLPLLALSGILKLRFATAKLRYPLQRDSKETVA